MTYEHDTIQSRESVAAEIDEWVDDARELARAIGLDPYPVKYWVVTNEEMNELITYNGFQQRYPHWRWGMQYDMQQKKSQFLGGKAFEIVNNDNPAHAFLQRSNTMADQKAVVTHVEAHADFFKNNRWFEDDPDASHRLAEHGRRIEEIMDRPDVDREDVESLIDTALCIEDTIDQHRLHKTTDRDDETTVEEHIEELDIDESVKEAMFDSDWIDEVNDGDDGPAFHDDVFGFVIEHGRRYDEDDGRSRSFEDWEIDVLEMIRDEAYYFAAQKMTKVMNEGFASFFETIMMANEGFADDDEFVQYADHHAKVLEAPGFNPYKLGREIWEYIENKTNRDEIVDKLLRVEGITPGNFHRKVDFDRVEELLLNPDSYSPAVRNFSLVRPKNRGWLRNTSRETIQERWRYMFDTDRYETIEEAIDDVNYSAGWERIREVRATHVDSTFIAQFITDEFIEKNNYFTYDYNPKRERMEVSSTDPKDVKQKLLMKFTNFGKPTIVAEDRNYNNAGELLLTHQYNGITIDIDQAKSVLERLYNDMWGRPVHLRTITKVNGEEAGVMLSYDGETHTSTQLDWSAVEDIQADEIDYDVRPDEWLA